MIVPIQNLHCALCRAHYGVRRDGEDNFITLFHATPSPGCDFYGTVLQFKSTDSILAKPMGDGTPIISIPQYAKCPNCSGYHTQYEMDELRVIYYHVGVIGPVCTTRVVFPNASFMHCI